MLGREQGDGARGVCGPRLRGRVGGEQGSRRLHRVRRSETLSLLPERQAKRQWIRLLFNSGRRNGNYSLREIRTKTTVAGPLQPSSGCDRICGWGTIPRCMPPAGAAGRWCRCSSGRRRKKGPGRRAARRAGGCINRWNGWSGSFTRQVPTWLFARARPQRSCCAWPRRRGLMRSSGTGGMSLPASPATGKSRPPCVRRGCRLKSATAHCSASRRRSATRRGSRSASSPRSGGRAWPPANRAHRCPRRANSRLRPGPPASLPLAALGLEPKLNWAAGLRAAWQPGSAGARAELQRFLHDGVLTYDEGRNRPDRVGTSRLSPHLHFGEISPRQVWQAVRRFAEAQSIPATSVAPLAIPDRAGLARVRAPFAFPLPAHGGAAAAA